eukprot:TRINITY_DN28438_c0_g1_i1.p1 TRINITY_DN28438_c0_g1~~TRINITY_DN28438_c0_g1_i1.p1  ORF type:complete len:771 (-),score=102.08 TRINITY_DN28438_c0_g1_i1:21-2333(-)
MFLVLLCALHLAVALDNRHYPEELIFLQHPSGWDLVAEEQAQRDSGLLSVIVAVRHEHEVLVEAALRAVSDPSSSQYGKYWQLDEKMAADLGARANAKQLRDWLQNEGGAINMEETFAGEFLRCQLSVSQAERLFDVSLHPFRHQSSGQLRYGMHYPQRYSVPAFLAAQVDFVSGLHIPREKQTRPSPHSYSQAFPSRSTTHDKEAGHSSVLIVESRDRAFQVHVSVLLPEDFVARICSSQPDTPCESQENGGPVRGFDAVATPVSLAGKEFLPPVELHGSIQPGACTANASGLSASATNLVCVVVFGPSLGLVNFAPTSLRLQAIFADGSRGTWGTYSMLAYPSLGMTVLDLRKLYKVPSEYRNLDMKNSQALASFFNISTSEADASLFHNIMGTRRQPNVTFVGHKSGAGVEGNIDLQWIQAMGNNVPTTYWATPGGDPAHAHEPFLEWLVDLANTSQPPLVHSLSYGENEADYSLAYENRGNLELAKLGLRGVTVLAATGDTGVQGAAQQGGSPPRCAPYAPVWPASSPYITAVGATMISNHVSEVCNVKRVYAMGTNSSMPFSCPEMDIGEIVCTTEKGAMITGGGGFSDRFPRPFYQNEAVDEYLMNPGLGLNTSLFNASGRAYPDISAIGQNIPIVFEGQLVMVGGTSSSSPIVAGLVALLNGERLAAGHAPLGFLNPLLYSVYAKHPTIVNDVRVGSNRGSNLLLPPEQFQNCHSGFPAAPGWDASTGLGSPNFMQMRRLFAQGLFRQPGGEAKFASEETDWV